MKTQFISLGCLHKGDIFKCQDKIYKVNGINQKIDGGVNCQEVATGKKKVFNVDDGVEQILRKGDV